MMGVNNATFDLPGPGYWYPSIDLGSFLLFPLLIILPLGNSQFFFEPQYAKYFHFLYCPKAFFIFFSSNHTFSSELTFFLFDLFSIDDIRLFVVVIHIISLFTIMSGRSPRV